MILTGTFHFILFGTFIQSLISNPQNAGDNLLVILERSPQVSTIFIGFILVGGAQVAVGLLALYKMGKLLFICSSN